MERELALEFVRVTEAAAIASGRFMGKGDKIGADQAAVNGMRGVFDTIHLNGTVVIGEGEKDEAPMLYTGEKLGTGEKPEVDIAVDPLEGTNLVAKGLPNSIAVVAIAEKGNLLHAPDMYMEKIAVGPKAAGKIDIDKSIEENLASVAKALSRKIEDLTVVILDRPRHKEIIEKVRKASARIKLISDGDVAPAIATGFENSGVDMVLGIGGAPEGVIAAAGLKCLGGEFQGRLKPFKNEDIEKCSQMGIKDIDCVYCMDQLVGKGEVFFSATGITDGDLLKGIRYIGNGASTHSLVMRAKTGTIRFIEAIHKFDKKPRYAKGDI